MRQIERLPDSWLRTTVRDCSRKPTVGGLNGGRPPLKRQVVPLPDLTRTSVCEDFGCYFEETEDRSFVAL